MEFLCAPLLLDCGHAFCRLCLLQSARLAPDGRHCPTCRAPVNLQDPAKHPENESFAARIRDIVPQAQLQVRAATEATNLAAFLERDRSSLPVFYMRGAASRVGEQFGIHLFEPRYRILIRRSWEGNRRFICAQRKPVTGDTALVVEVTVAKFLAGGNADIAGIGIAYAVLQNVRVEEGTAGLHYADINDAAVDTAESRSSPTSGRQRSLTDGMRGGEGVELGEFPVFYLGCQCPSAGSTIRMRFFEPRYTRLASEVLASTHRTFLYAGSRPAAGMLAAVVRVDTCDWCDNGNAMVEGHVTTLIRIASVRQESDGLFYASRTSSGDGTVREVSDVEGQVKVKCCAIQ